MQGRKRTSPDKLDRGNRLAEALRRRRLRRGLSAQDLGRLASVSPETIRRIEQHLTHDPGFFTVVDLADALGLPLADLARAAKTIRRRRNVPRPPLG